MDKWDESISPTLCRHWLLCCCFSPPLTWYSRMGGKSLLASTLIPMFHHARVYVEPFVGAGHLLLRMPKGTYDMEIINDRDETIYQLFSDVKEVNAHDVSAMDFTADRKRWLMIHGMDVSSLPPKERLESNLYHVYLSYAGMLTSFHDYGKTDHSSRNATLLKKLDLIQDRLERVVVRNDDYREVIREMDGEDVFFYLDPPYYEVDVSGYKFSRVDPTELKGVLDGCMGKWLLSYNDHPFIREVFADYRIEEVSTMYTIAGRRVKKELVIMNY